MPLHFNSISNELTKETFNWMVRNTVENNKEMHATEDGKFIHCWTDLIDEISGKSVGELVATFENVDGTMQLLDFDMTLNNDEAVEVEFVAKHEESSNANEYYQVEVVGKSHRINIETVKRHLIEGELEDTSRKVKLSAFPFSLSVYKDVEELNKELWPEDGIKIEGLEKAKIGFAENYAGCSLDGEIYSMIIGKVERFQEIRFVADKNIDFLIVWINSAVGTLPTAVCRDVFDLEDLEVGKTIAMNTDIKADLII